MPVVDEVSVDVRADDAQFRDVMRRFDRTVTAADARTITVGATGPRGGAAGVPGAGGRGGPANEDGEDKRHRNKERNDERRHRETSRLLKTVAAVSGVAASSQGLLGPLPQLATNLLMAPLVGVINELAGKLAGPLTGGLGLVDKTVDVIDNNTFGGQRGDTPARPGTGLDRARSKYAAIKQSGAIEATGAAFSAGFGPQVGRYAENMLETNLAIGLGVAEAGKDLFSGMNRWWQRRGHGRDPDSTYENRNQQRASSSGGYN